MNQYLKTDYYLKDYLSKSLLLAIPMKINLKDLKKTKIKYPSKKEQEKIAKFLSLIDKKIGLLEETLFLSQKHTRKSMQNIFENLNGDEFLLSEVLNYKSSNLSLDKLESENESYPLYGAEGLIKFIDSYELDGNYIGIIKDGAGVGRINYYNGKSSVLGTMAYLTSKNEFNLKFIYYQLKIKNFKKYIVGSSIPHLYFKDYSKEKVIIPSINIQNRIAKFFELLNQKTSNIQIEINEMKKFKKYLMQQMFI